MELGNEYKFPKLQYAGSKFWVVHLLDISKIYLYIAKGSTGDKGNVTGDYVTYNVSSTVFPYSD